MKFIFLTFFSLSVFAQNIPQCPPESFVVEFNSPITKAKKAFCAYQKNGETIKHGEELIFDTNGEVRKRIVYNHGVEGEAPTAAIAVPEFKGKNLPGTEESSAKFTDTLIGSQPLNEEQKLLAIIHDLMAVLTLKKESPGKGMFKIGQCDDKPLDWLKGAVFNSPISKSYVFKDRCDVKGSFSANFTTDFPMKFELRNLQDFSNTEMTVKMKVNKSASGIRYGFEVIEGFIVSPSKKAHFKVEYEIDINPLTGEPSKSSQTGKVTLTKIDSKDVNVSAPLKFYE